MSVEICVSAEELKKTLEYMALISAPGLKKKDEDETAGAMRIKAVSPKGDYRYMLMFCRVGTAEQLVYRMEGKSRTGNEPVDVYVDGKRFIALAKTFAGDVYIGFNGNEVVLNVGRSEYKLATVVTKMPDLVVPGGAVPISAKFLEDALKHCAPVISKSAQGVRAGVNFKIAADGSAVCWAGQNHCGAKYTVPSAGCGAMEITLLPADIQRVAALAAGDEIKLVTTPNGIYFTSLRFDYMCYCLQGLFPDYDKAQAKFKQQKRLSVNKSELVAAVNRCCVIAGDEGSVQVYSTGGDFVVEAASSCGNGQECITATDIDGADDSFNHLPAALFLRLIYACQGDSVTIATSGRFGAFIISASGSANYYLLMPRRVGA